MRRPGRRPARGGLRALAGAHGELDVLVHALAFAKREDLEGGFIGTSRDGFALALDVSAYSLVARARGAAASQAGLEHPDAHLLRLGKGRRLFHLALLERPLGSHLDLLTSGGALIGGRFHLGGSGARSVSPTLQVCHPAVEFRVLVDDWQALSMSSAAATLRPAAMVRVFGIDIPPCRRLDRMGSSPAANDLLHSRTDRTASVACGRASSNVLRMVSVRDLLGTRAAVWQVCYCKLTHRRARAS